MRSGSVAIQSDLGTGINAVISIRGVAMVVTVVGGAYCAEIILGKATSKTSTPIRTGKVPLVTAAPPESALNQDFAPIEVTWAFQRF
jgi:hypothetical protein